MTSGKRDGSQVDKRPLQIVILVDVLIFQVFCRRTRDLLLTIECLRLLLSPICYAQHVLLGLLHRQRYPKKNKGGTHID